jgi:intein/homing endonuclease
MAIPREQILVMNSKGERINIDDLINSFSDDDPRVLVNDEIGKVVYLADLDLYQLQPLPDGNHLAQKITEMSSARFGTNLVRRQIGDKVLSVTSDTIFLVKKDEHIVKIRAEKLKKGMILATGEKVFS